MSIFGNPMIEKELKQRLRERRAWVLPSLYLLLLSSVILLTYYEESARQVGGGAVQGADIGVSIFSALILTQAVVLLLMAPVFGAGGITIEKEQRTFASLLTTLLTPAEIWWGKFVSSLLYLLLLLLCSLPLLAISFAFGGVEPTEVLLATFYLVLVLGAVCALGLLCSTLFRRSVHSTAATYGLVLVLTVVTTIVFVYLQDHWRRERLESGIDGIPIYVQAPLLLNPLYPLLTLAGIAGKAEFPFALSSCLLFGAMLLLSAAFAMWLLKRSGEQV